MKRYASAIGLGFGLHRPCGLKEGQVIKQMQEEREKKQRREITDEDVLGGIADTEERSGTATVRKNKSGITVKGIHDLAAAFSKCCNPVPGDEIVGFVTRGRGVSIHRTDCINMINLPEDERSGSLRRSGRWRRMTTAMSSTPRRSRSLPTTGSACLRISPRYYGEAD